MPDQIVLDLGEYGSVLIEAEETIGTTEAGLVQAGRLDDARQLLTVKAQSLLQKPLTGLANAIIASLPEEQIGTVDPRYMSHYWPRPRFLTVRNWYLRVRRALNQRK